MLVLDVRPGMAQRDGNLIHVVVALGTRGQCYKIKLTQPLKKLMRVFCKRNHLIREDTRFYVRDAEQGSIEVYETDTGEDLELGWMGVIHARCYARRTRKTFVIKPGRKARRQIARKRCVTKVDGDDLIVQQVFLLFGISAWRKGPLSVPC